MTEISIIVSKKQVMQNDWFYTASYDTLRKYI